MSVRTARSPLPFRPSSTQGKDSILKPHPPSPYCSSYGSKTPILNRETSNHRPLPRGPGPLDDKGRRLRLTDYKSTSSFRPKKTSLPSTFGTNQPLRATHSSDVGSRYYSSRYRDDSTLKYNLSQTGNHRSRSISDLTRGVNLLQVDEYPLRTAYKESSFGNVSDRIQKSRLLSYSTNNSPGQRSYQHSDPRDYSRSSYLSSPSSRLSRQDSYPSSSQTSDSESPRDRSRSSSRTRKLNRSSSLLSPLNVSLISLHNFTSLPSV